MRSGRSSEFRGIAALVMACLGWVAPYACGQTPIPSDISVHLSAQPDRNLRTGQAIEFTLSTTNHGPEPVQQEALISSDVYLDELVFGSVVSCPHFLAAVGNGSGQPFTTYFWYLTQDRPLAVGETRTCTFRLKYGPKAGSSYAFSFARSGNYPDINPANDSATVILRRWANAIPLLSPIALILLACALAALAGRSLSTARRR